MYDPEFSLLPNANSHTVSAQMRILGLITADELGTHTGEKNKTHTHTLTRHALISPETTNFSWENA